MSTYQTPANIRTLLLDPNAKNALWEVLALYKTKRNKKLRREREAAARRNASAAAAARRRAKFTAYRNAFVGRVKGARNSVVGGVKAGRNSVVGGVMAGRNAARAGMAKANPLGPKAQANALRRSQAAQAGERNMANTSVWKKLRARTRMAPQYWSLGQRFQKKPVTGNPFA